jgi:hypothetical protein
MLPSLDPIAMSEHGRLLGSGVHRRAFSLLDQYVVKVAKGPHGAEANRLEADSWDWLSTGDGQAYRDAFCPVTAACPDGWWLIMPKCRPSGWIYGESPVDKARQARIVGDLHAENTMLAPDTGELVVTDYGFGVGPFKVDGLEGLPMDHDSSMDRRGECACPDCEGEQEEPSCRCPDCQGWRVPGTDCWQQQARGQESCPDCGWRWEDDEQKTDACTCRGCIAHRAGRCPEAR